MVTRNLFCFIYIGLLFTITYSLTIREIIKRDPISFETYKDGECYYCKDDICVPCSNRSEFDTVIIPDKEGVNKTYITEGCSSKDIDLDLCFSKNCTADSECLSNKCIKGHCSTDEDNPIIQCQYVRTIHSNPIFGDAKGYKTHCGLPAGYKCNSNKDCSSFNCERYTDYRICGEPDDGGCHSACSLGSAFVMMAAVPIYIIVFIISCCCCCCYKHHSQYRKYIKYSALAFVVLSPIPWIVLLSYDIYDMTEDASVTGHVISIIILVVIATIIAFLICRFWKIKKEDEDDEIPKVDNENLN
ncbi:hypothetical protein BCR32DRAFT_265582 [Anaeromyces robustus]|uniref:Uncharacterized protein n=1 Tax=Anaeromyces robustus TaxID=1754192 RepID=A0A1Y1XJI6_9FUNG|nr:hypothetical protein BCR32DRAFT_265582 [Anaeromyces robustus]|eukprot:ORX85524.1 hypothetical protein BCR32DRAFT_265582 [Anaeromyces robustus]